MDAHSLIEENKPLAFPGIETATQAGSTANFTGEREWGRGTCPHYRQTLVARISRRSVSKKVYGDWPVGTDPAVRQFTSEP